jgi:hypothetical protein
MTESTYVNDVIGQEDKFDGRQGVIPGREDVAGMRPGDGHGVAAPSSRPMSATFAGESRNSEASPLPGWLPWVNRLVMVLQRLGLKTGTIHVLSLPGRISGRLRATPVSLLSVAGQRYIVAGLDDADWVRNARAAGWGILRYGRSEERVTLNELPVGERAAILREFPRLVPHGVQYFQRMYGVTADPDAFAGLADRCPVFRVVNQ